MLHDTSSFRILSLDGGGVWGLVEVHALIDLYSECATGHQVLGDFNLVAANSAGALVLAALCVDMKLADILKLFTQQEQLRKIFVRLPWYHWLNPLAWFVGGPRWSTAGKLAGLTYLLAPNALCSLDSFPSTIGGRQPQLLIVGFDYDRQRAVFFRSNSKSRAANFAPAASLSLLESVHASSDAPVRFFDRPTLAHTNGRTRYWDGGVAGYNNPVLAAVVEALAKGGARKRNTSAESWYGILRASSG